MDVLIAADMEGIAGIEDYRECLPSHPAAYARGRALMTDEVLAAVAALRAGGVDRIAVGDWHMVGTNIERERMPAGVDVRPIADLALVEAQPSIAKASGGSLDAIVFVGHHTSTLAPRGFSSHTLIWEMEVELDGQPLNEIQIYAQGLAAEGIPVLAAAGDQRMLDELGEGELGAARLLATKEGQGRARARCQDVAASRTELAAAIAAALAAPMRPPPPRGYPAELRIAVAGKELTRTAVSAPSDLLTTIATVFRGSHVSREYRQLAKLLPAGHDSRARALQRRLGSLLATPTMRARERQWLASPAG